MIESKKLVPEHYRKSYDFGVFLKLLDYIVASYKGEVDDINSFIVPNRCPKDYLPMLADYVGYKYDPNVSEDVNRKIIEEYINLIKIRGSLDSIGYALAVAIRAVQKTQTPINKLFLIDKSRKILTQAEQDYYGEELDSEYTVNAFLYSENFSYKMWDLVKAVRPAGMNVIINSSSVVDTDATTEQANLSVFISKLYRATLAKSYYTTSSQNVEGAMTGWQSGVSISVTRKNIPNQNDVVDTEENTGNQGSSVNFVEASHSIPNIEIPDDVTVLFDVRNGDGNEKLTAETNDNNNNIILHNDNACSYIFDPYFGYSCMYGRYAVLKYIACYLTDKIDLSRYRKLYVVCGYSLTSDYNENTNESTNGVFKIKTTSYVGNLHTLNTVVWSTSVDNMYSDYCVIEIDVSRNNEQDYLCFVMENSNAKPSTEHLDSFSIYAVYGGN